MKDQITGYGYVYGYKKFGFNLTYFIWKLLLKYNKYKYHISLIHHDYKTTDSINLYWNTTLHSLTLKTLCLLVLRHIQIRLLACVSRMFPEQSPCLARKIPEHTRKRSLRQLHIRWLLNVQALVSPHLHIWYLIILNITF